MNREEVRTLKLALDLEREEADYYRLAADKTKDAGGKKVFAYLAEEEDAHLKALRRQLASVKEKESWLSDEELFNKKACGTLTRRKPHGIVPDNVKADANDLEALRQAIGIEKKSISYYEDAACKVSDKKALKMFHYLIEAEKEHLQELETQLLFLASEGIWYDNTFTLS